MSPKINREASSRIGGAAALLRPPVWNRTTSRT
jgi:hypothetical protein